MCVMRPSHLMIAVCPYITEAESGPIDANIVIQELATRKPKSLSPFLALNIGNNALDSSCHLRRKSPNRAWIILCKSSSDHTPQTVLFIGGLQASKALPMFIYLYFSITNYFRTYSTHRHKRCKHFKCLLCSTVVRHRNTE